MQDWLTLVFPEKDDILCETRKPVGFDPRECFTGLWCGYFHNI